MEKTISLSILSSVFRKFSIDANMLGQLQERIAAELGCTTQVYPDGSLLISGENNDRLNRPSVITVMNKWGFLLPKEMYLPDVVFVTFSNLFSSEEDAEVWFLPPARVGEDTTQIFPNRITDPNFNVPFDAIPVHVVFKKKLNPQTRDRFLLMLKNFFSSVFRDGMFGEGPIRLKNNEISFYSRLAEFTIDASASGPDTLNWLIIRLLRFSGETPITRIDFNKYAGETRDDPDELRDPSFAPPVFEKHGKLLVPSSFWQERSERPFRVVSFEEEYGLSKQKKITRSLEDFQSVNNHGPSNTHNTANTPGEHVNPGEDPLSDIIPNNAVSHKFLSSELFPILMTPQTTYESLWINIFFEALCTGENHFLVKMIQDWANIGLLGGYGGCFSYFSEPHYDNERNILSIQCDFGQADPQTALNILVNILNALEGITVIALVFSQEKIQ